MRHDCQNGGPDPLRLQESPATLCPGARGVVASNDILGGERGELGVPGAFAAAAADGDGSDTGDGGDTNGHRGVPGGADGLGRGYRKRERAGRDRPGVEGGRGVVSIISIKCTTWETGQGLGYRKKREGMREDSYLRDSPIAAVYALL